MSASEIKRYLCIAGVIFMFGSAEMHAQISPGSLSRAHSFLDGPTHCTSCHDLAKTSAEFKCVECHKEIRIRLSEKRGLHPSLVGGDSSGRTCASCHSEHNGRDFSLVHWEGPVAKFDHHRAGYALEGRHANLTCKTCHQPARIPVSATAEILVKDMQRTYLGLPRSCYPCHSDEHRGQLGSNCERCHDSSNWKNAARFDHNRARFALDGAHEKLACVKCHLPVQAEKPFTKYKGISFENCSPCHSDPHRGAFQAACRTCHSAASWKSALSTIAFNHNDTRYPLEGKHTAVGCAACHLASNFKAPVPHDRCVDCHKKDPHHGQFSQRADGGECKACHRVEGFKPSIFTVAQHAGTRFRLVDRHTTVACSKCHEPRGTDTSYRFSDMACGVCHADIHRGQFGAPPHENRCEDCHTAKEFIPSTFTLARHMKSRFPLSGAHAAVVCVDCHKSAADVFPPTPVKYRLENRGCAACHADPHQGEFAQRMAVLTPGGVPGGCSACHTTTVWKELTGFDHDKTGFTLEGGHRVAACESCHKPRNLQAGLKAVIFNSAPRDCSGCHEDIHGGQFSRGTRPTDCERCHIPSRWKPSTFDHETGSSYHLDGAHKNVQCALCHATAKEISGRQVVMYSPTPRECIACHGNTANRS